jgi:hypothetical protein
MYYVLSSIILAHSYVDDLVSHQLSVLFITLHKILVGVREIPAEARRKRHPIAKLRSKHFGEQANSRLALPLNGAFMYVYTYASCGVASYLLQASWPRLLLEVRNCLRQVWDPRFNLHWRK